MQNKKRFDVIVVGSGIGGLTAAIELASQGDQVLVLEQHYLLGGACTTYPRRGGFLFDAGVESISGLGERGPVYHFLKKHGMEHSIEWIRNRYAFQYKGTQSTIPLEWEQWREELIEQFPQNATGIEGFFTTCRAAYEEQYRAFAPDRVTPHIPKKLVELIKYPFQCPNYYKWMKYSWGDFLDAFIHVPELRVQLSMLTGYVGDAGENTPAKVMFPIMGYFIDGGFRPKGGSGQLAKEMVKKIQDYGGEVKSRCEVSEILIENNQVVGIKTKKGELYETPLVISNVDPRITFEALIQTKNVPFDILNKAKELQPSMSLYIWTAALSRPFPFDEMTHVKLDEPIELPINEVRIHAYSFQSSARIDPSLAPEGKGNLLINFKAEPCAQKYKKMEKAEYEKCKEEIDLFCRKAVANIDQESADAILFSEVATPKTVEYYMRTYEGSIYSSKINCQDDFPAMQTPIQGLYLTGAGVGYGPGIEAVVITGAEVAEKIKEGS